MTGGTSREHLVGEEGDASVARAADEAGGEARRARLGDGGVERQQGALWEPGGQRPARIPLG